MGEPYLNTVHQWEDVQNQKTEFKKMCVLTLHILLPLPSVRLDTLQKEIAIVT